MVNHHPDTRLLNEYSSGALPLAQSACVSLHLKYCEQCRRMYQGLQQLGSALFEELAPQTVDDSLLRSVLSRLETEHEPEPDQTAFAGKPEDHPSLVQRLATGEYENLDWKRINSGLRISRLKTGDTHYEFALYHIKAGNSIPRHTHRGTELTLVLEGSFSDEDGHYSKGDFIFRDAEKVHTPTASQDRDCICIGVLDAPGRFTGWQYRVLNPFLKLQAH